MADTELILTIFYDTAAPFLVRQVFQNSTLLYKSYFLVWEHVTYDKIGLFQTSLSTDT